MEPEKSKTTEQVSDSMKMSEVSPQIQQLYKALERLSKAMPLLEEGAKLHEKSPTSRILTEEEFKQFKKDVDDLVKRKEELHKAKPPEKEKGEEMKIEDVSDPAIRKILMTLKGISTFLHKADTSSPKREKDVERKMTTRKGKVAPGQHVPDPKKKLIGEPPGNPNTPLPPEQKREGEQEKLREK